MERNLFRWVVIRGVVKSKLDFNDKSNDNVVPAVEIHSQECLPPSSYKALKCCCSKVCKGARGLKMHQRSCRVIDGMEEELQQQMTDALNDKGYEDSVQSVENVVPSLNSEESYPDLKKGIKLPKLHCNGQLLTTFFNSLFQTTQSQCKKSIKEINNYNYNHLPLP